jgi:PPE-repeat protein
VDFAGLPPELTSALIESGPGAESFIEASDAWQQLGSNLEDAAGIYAGVTSQLTAQWEGASSAAMIQAVRPYLSWLRTTARQCEQTASSAQAAAAAFSAARAGVIPFPEVIANRTRLAQLLATNTFGINLPAIAQTEDQYQGMWANNTAVLNRYQAASAQAAALPQFAVPPTITNPTGVAAQSAATSAAAATPADAVTDALSSLTSINPVIDFSDPNKGWLGFINTYANQFVAGGIPINLLSYLAENAQAKAFQGLGDIGQGLSQGASALGASTADAVTGAGSAPTAAMGVGVSVGKLTAPASLVGVVSASQTPVQLASAATPLSAGEAEFPMLPPLMAPPISAGSGWRKRKQQQYGEREDSEDEENEEYERPANPSEEPLPDVPGSGWRKRANYDDIEFGAQLPGTVMKKPPSAG